MDSMLEALFDYQRFEREETLQSVIDEVEGRAGERKTVRGAAHPVRSPSSGIPLSDETLYQVAAAGDPQAAQAGRTKHRDGDGRA